MLNVGHVEYHCSYTHVLTHGTYIRDLVILALHVQLITKSNTHNMKMDSIPFVNTLNPTTVNKFS